MPTKSLGRASSSPTRLTTPMRTNPSMSEGKRTASSPLLLRVIYAGCLGHGMGIGVGTGSPPSAASTPVSLSSQAGALRFAFFDIGAWTTLGKTATAAKKPNVTSVPRTLSFDIFISLKKIARTGTANTTTFLDPAPRVGGEGCATNFVRFLVGMLTKSPRLAMYQSV